VAIAYGIVHLHVLVGGMEPPPHNAHTFLVGVAKCKIDLICESESKMNLK
jgi:hypothetical protein